MFDELAVMQPPPPIGHLKLISPPESERPSEERVRKLEGSIGAPLPADYRAFLLQYGGCLVSFQAPVGEPSPFGDTFTQTRFHSLFTDPEAVGDIRSYLTSQIVPRNMIVIASGDFGQAACLSFAGIDKGAVFCEFSMSTRWLSLTSRTCITVRMLPSESSCSCVTRTSWVSSRPATTTATSQHHHLQSS